MNLLLLFRAVFKKRLILLIRYPVNTLSQLVTIYLFFVVIFYGGQALVGASFSNTLSGIIVGFFIWTMAIIAYSGLAWNMTREAQWGTLEQLFMSPFGFGRVISTTVVVNVLFGFLWGGGILALMLLTTGRTIYLDLLTIVPIGILTLASAVGVGFVFGGLALLYKRIENAFQLVQFAFIGLIAAPVGQYEWLSVLPLAQGSYLLRRAMSEGISLVEMSPTNLAVLCGTAIGYAGVGYYLFHRAQRRARRKGVMGHY